MTTVRPALSLLAFFTLLTGLAYPFAITAVAQTLMPERASGSLIRRQGTVIGSALIGQPFEGARYFWSRPSATTGRPYNAASSSGSNLGPTNPKLVELVDQRRARLTRGHEGSGEPPMGLLTASGSGLDPHISVEAALYQVDRVAKARGLDPARLRRLIERRAEGRFLALFGEPRVNVLLLNLALEAGEVSN